MVCPLTVHISRPDRAPEIAQLFSKKNRLALFSYLIKEQRDILSQPGSL